MVAVEWVQIEGEGKDEEEQGLIARKIIEDASHEDNHEEKVYTMILKK